MKNKIILCLSIFLLSVVPARAFVFSDVPALGQRTAQFMQTAAHYVESKTHYISSGTHFKEVANYAQEFNKYKNQFDSYYKSFNRVYRRMSSDQYYRDFDVSTWNWKKLDDHLIRAWRKFNQTSWDMQVLLIRGSRLYLDNPRYRAYADKLITLSEEQAVRLKQEEAAIAELEEQDAKHKETLQNFRNTNAGLTVGNDEASLTHQIALTNSILMELTAIQTETKAIEQRLLTNQREQQSLISQMKQLEIEAQKDDGLNFDWIFETTQRR